MIVLINNLKSTCFSIYTSVKGNLKVLIGFSTLPIIIRINSRINITSQVHL
jgi:hypothetical protein